MDGVSDVTKFLNPERLDGLMSTGLAMGTKVLIALFIFIIGSWIAKRVAKWPVLLSVWHYKVHYQIWRPALC